MIFAFPVICLHFWSADFCQIFFVSSTKEISLPLPGIEPGNSWLWSHCATILPQPLLIEISKTWRLIYFILIPGVQLFVGFQLLHFCSTFRVLDFRYLCISHQSILDPLLVLWWARKNKLSKIYNVSICQKEIFCKYSSVPLFFQWKCNIWKEYHTYLTLQASREFSTKLTLK